jgi:uncharacterized lipoprotein YmbA
MSFGQLVSCGGASPVNKSLYALDPGRPASDSAQQAAVGLAAAAASAREQVLLVRRVNIAPPFDGTSLIHRQPGGTYVKDYYNDWVAPPEELLSADLIDWLSASGPFASVVDGRSAAPHRFVLETSISSFYGDFEDPHDAKVILSARIYLIDDTSGNHSVAFQNHYDIAVPLAHASAQELVLGSGRAYRQLLEALTQDLFAFGKTRAAAADAR